MEQTYQAGQLLEDSEILIRKILDEFREEDDYMLMIDSIEYKYWSIRMTLELSVKLKPIQSVLIEDVHYLAQGINSIQSLNFFILVHQNQHPTISKPSGSNQNPGSGTNPSAVSSSKQRRDIVEEETFLVSITSSYFLRIRDLHSAKLKMLKDFVTFLLNVGYKVFEAIKYHSDNMFIGRAKNLFQNFIDIASSTIELQQKIDFRTLSSVLQLSDKSFENETWEKRDKTD